MVASPRIQAITEGALYLQVLAEFLKNPKLIKTLEEEVVKLNILSAEEEARLHEAKVLMQQKDILTKEIEDQKKTLIKEKTDHDLHLEKKSKEFDNRVAEIEKGLEKRSADLDAFETKLNDYSALLDQRENQLKEKAAVMKGLFKE